MPSEILSRIPVPVPSIRVYSSLSVLLVAGCVYYSFSVTSDPSWKQNVNITLHYPPVSLDNSVLPLAERPAEVDMGLQATAAVPFSGDMLKETGDFRTIMDQLRDMMAFMGQEAICIWVSECSVLCLVCVGICKRVKWVLLFDGCR